MNLGIFLEQVPDGDGAWWQMLASGLGWTLGTAFFAWIVAFTLGSIVGVVRTTDSQRLSVVRTTPTIDPRVKATIQAKKAVPRVQPRPDASICHQAPSPSGTCSRKIPRFILDVPSDGAAYAFWPTQKSRTGDGAIRP